MLKQARALNSNHKRTANSLVLSSLLACLCANSSSGQLLFHFDSVQEFTQNFFEAGLSTGSQFSYSTNPGVGGTPGRVDKGFDFAESLLYVQPFGFSASPVLYSSTIFYYEQEVYSPGRENLEVVQLGFVNAHTNGLYRARPDTAYVSEVIGRGGGEYTSPCVSISNRAASVHFRQTCFFPPRKL